MAQKIKIPTEVCRIAAEFMGQIRQHMVKRKITQAKLALRLNVSESAVSQALNGKCFTITTAIRYARAVGMKVAIVTTEHQATANGIVQAWKSAGRPKDFFEVANRPADLERTQSAHVGTEPKERGLNE